MQKYWKKFEMAKIGHSIFLEPYWWKKIGRNSELVKLGIPNISKPFCCKTIGRSSEKCKVYIGPMAVSETAVTITIAKMGTGPICLRHYNRNRKCQWEWYIDSNVTNLCNVTIAIAIAITIAITEWEWTFSLKQP